MSSWVSSLYLCFQDWTLLLDKCERALPWEHQFPSLSSSYMPILHCLPRSLPLQGITCHCHYSGSHGVGLSNFPSRPRILKLTENLWFDMDEDSSSIGQLLPMSRYWLWHRRGCNAMQYTLCPLEWELSRATHCFSPSEPGKAPKITMDNSCFCTSSCQIHLQSPESCVWKARCFHYWEVGKATVTRLYRTMETDPL